MTLKHKKELATKIVQRLRHAGFAAYFVGGCVRDMLMRKVPKDIDIATEAKISQIEKIFSGKTYPIGEKFGTLLVVKNKVPFQISTFRREKGKYSSNLAEDLKLRDFTINGLAYDPIEKKIIDPVGGKEDIRKKKIHAIGQASLRFKQDPLRLIRAIRFAVTLGFDIEGETLQAIQKMARFVKKVSRERIREELILIFSGPRPGGGLKLLDKTGLLKQILPEVDRLKGVAQPRAFHPEGDVFAHTLLMLEKLKHAPLVLTLSCLFHDIGKPATFQVSDRIRFSGHDREGAEITDNILRRLKFSNQQRKDIAACVENHMRIMDAPKMREATLKRLFARPTFIVELKLHYIDCIASHKDLRVWRFLKKKYAEFQRKPAIPKPLLDGFELIKIGFTPGPIFGTIHRQMVDLQLEGRLKNKSEARKWVLNKFKTPNSKRKI